ncbi:MAG: DUF3078 domain-containing protein [Bacteroidales bacterium]|nr:DUF3078 domain-containing protein [Bacteroidales bacterium]
MNYRYFLLVVLSLTFLPLASRALPDGVVDTSRSDTVARKPSLWVYSLKTNIGFSQTQFTRWASGGYNTATLATYVDATLDLLQGAVMVKNRLQVDHGILVSEEKPVPQISKDRLYLESRAQYISPIRHVMYLGTFDLKTQITNNYTYTTPTVEDPTAADWKATRVLKSAPFAPGYINMGLGATWSTWKWLTVSYTPLTFGLVTTSNVSLRKNYGMPLRSQYESIESPEDYMYHSQRFEFGSQLKIDIKVNLRRNMEWISQLSLFTDYLAFEKSRLNLDTKFYWKLSRFFTLTVSNFNIYDGSVLVVDEDHPGGRKVWQLKEFIEFGFTYSMASKKH